MYSHYIIIYDGTDIFCEFECTPINQYKKCTIFTYLIHTISHIEPAANVLYICDE